MTADRCRSLWPLVLLRDLDWIGGWCSSPSCHFVSFAECSWASSLGGAASNHLALKKWQTCSLIFNLKQLWSSAWHLFWFCCWAFRTTNSSVERLICPQLLKGDVVQWFYFCSFLSFFTPRNPLLILNFKAPWKALHLLSVLYVFFLLWGCFWLEKLYQPHSPAGKIKKNPAVLLLMNPACWFIFPQEPSPSCLLPIRCFILFLSDQVSSGGRRGRSLFFFKAGIFSTSLKTLINTLPTLTSWQPQTMEEEGFVIQGNLLSML